MKKRVVRISAEMAATKELLRQGLKAAEASRRTGISKAAISMSPECQAIIAEVKAKRAGVVNQPLDDGKFNDLGPA